MDYHAGKVAKAAIAICVLVCSSMTCHAQTPAAPTAEHAPPKIFQLWGPWSADDDPYTDPQDSDDDTFRSDATIGQMWQAQVDAVSATSKILHWQVVAPPKGLVLDVDKQTYRSEDGSLHNIATLKWTPGTDALAATEIELRVLDEHGGMASRSFPLHVIHGQHPPQLASLSSVDISEGQAMLLPISASDADGDALTILVNHMPPGASYNPDTHTLAWTPGYDQAGIYPDVTVTLSDGKLTSSRRFTITVAQAQPTAILPAVPTQTLHVGQAFSMQLPGHLPDDLELADGVTLKQLHYAPMPPYGMHISDTGLLTWTPEQAQLGKHTVEIGFKATYMPAIDNSDHTSRHKVMFDVLAALSKRTKAVSSITKPQSIAALKASNHHAPVIKLSNHLLVYGRTMRVPVVYGNAATTGIAVYDPDGEAPTHALAISFAGLPANAHYDAAKQQLTWEPQDIPSADVPITVKASDGQHITQKTFKVRVVPSPYAAVPGLELDVQPNAAAVPGQLIRVTAHTESFAGIASISAQVRGSGIGNQRWHALSLNGAHQFQIQSTQPGKIDVRVSVTDVDGHSDTQDKQLRVKDPAQTNDLALLWYGVLSGAGLNEPPTSISKLSAIEIAAHPSQTRSDYRLQIAPIGRNDWQTLAHGRLSTDGVQPITLTQLDPANYTNGVYQLRLIAWDGRAHSSEILARIIITSASKTEPLASHRDIIYTLGSHAIVLQRTLPEHATPDNDFGNWRWLGLDAHFSNDQTPTLAGDTNPAWSVGAQVWITLPADLTHPATSLTSLRFILNAIHGSSDNQAQVGASWRADFTSDQGWALKASNRQGLQVDDQHFYTGTVPWAPQGFILSAPDGTQYTLNRHGEVTAVRFLDGVQWLVSDAGIACVGEPTARISVLRDHHARIVRVTGPQGAADTMVYSYDKHGRLALARALDPSGTDTHYAYTHAGTPIVDSHQEHSSKHTLPVTSQRPTTLAHSDLAVRIPLDELIKVAAGTNVFWHVLGANHGRARLSKDAKYVIFSPQMGYSGKASVTVSAATAQASSAPIILPITISAAKLVAIELAPISDIEAGQSLPIGASVTFADGTHADVRIDPGYLHFSLADLKPLGQSGPAPLIIDDVRDTLHCTDTGAALLVASHRDADGRLVQAFQAINTLLPSIEVTAPDGDGPQRTPMAQPHVFPSTLALTPSDHRQLDTKVMDPGNNAIITLSGPASSASAQTRFVSSNPTVATVSDTGVITAHAQGEATVSALYLYNADWFSGGSGNLRSLGQGNVSVHVLGAQITDQDPTTPIPSSIKVGANQSAIIRASTGESVLIGTGVLKADTSVSIRRLPLDKLTALTAMPTPGPGVLEPLAAFHLDIGAKDVAIPIQAVIPAQANLGQPGDEIIFVRKGTVMLPGDKTQPTWWLLANGHIRRDGSLISGGAPFGGITASGDYVVCRVAAGVPTGHVVVHIPRGDWVNFDGLNISLAAGLQDASNDDPVTGALARAASGLSVGAYHYGVPQFGHMPAPKIQSKAAGKPHVMHAGHVLPPTPHPWGKVVVPKLSTPRYDQATGKIVLTVSDLDKGLYRGHVLIRERQANGVARDVASVPTTTDSVNVSIDPPKTVATRTLNWQVIRTLATDIYLPSGNLFSDKPVAFPNGYTQRFTFEANATVCDNSSAPSPSLLANVVTFMLLGKTNYASLGNALSSAVTSASNWSGCYIGDQGKLKVFDKITSKPLTPIPLPGQRNITSMTGNGDLMYIGVDANGLGGMGQPQLLIMDTSPTHRSQNRWLSVKIPALLGSHMTISSLAEGARKDILALVLHHQGEQAASAQPAQTSKILLLDLNTLNFTTGNIAPALVALPSTQLQSKVPLAVTTDNQYDNRFLVSYRGESKPATLLVSRTHQHLTSAQITPPA